MFNIIIAYALLVQYKMSAIGGSQKRTFKVLQQILNSYIDM